MKLLINPRPARHAALITATAEHDGDARRYYEIGSALIVTRNGLDLAGLVGRVVDASVGWDVAMAGFTLDESRIGKRRTKITIYRTVDGRWKRRLSELLKGK